ncbi:MAG: group II intron reverse transcriptase/maturase, partial [Candidatus Korarchaeota archaeon]|nr:group II intron reverse transcriptase/maturase [Candidatus Korarchaeota archaeon]
VVLSKTRKQTEEALSSVKHVLNNDLKLELSLEKTNITTFSKGFSFLGFDISSWSVKMRNKSVEKFKDKVRNLTIRCHNLDAEVINKLNQVIRGTANYFATSFSHCLKIFKRLDHWIRMRIRCMKFKRISRKDNFRLRLKHIRRLGLLSMINFCHS